MPEGGKKRGPHPEDASSFDPDQIPILQEAARDLSWLKTRGYADASALKIVGDRWKLNARQRSAVLRGSCSAQNLQRRRQRLVKPAELAGRTVLIDGFNLITTVEAALGGGVLLIGRDGCLRDMSGMHGNYRMLRDTAPAIAAVHDFLSLFHPASVTWYLDQPVSNSGRLKMRLLADARDFPLAVEVVPDPDIILGAAPAGSVVISADSAILDSCPAWCNAAREIVLRLMPGSRPSALIDFS